LTGGIVESKEMSMRLASALASMLPPTSLGRPASAAASLGLRISTAASSTGGCAASPRAASAVEETSPAALSFTLESD
jgi:hypothetical protein